LEFCPQRFADPLPAWGYLPFSAGRRTCLGSWFARLVLTTVLEVLGNRTLTSLGGDPAPRAGITLAPSGPLPLRLVA
jgi:cytochrome P450